MKKHLFAILAVFAMGIAACGSEHQHGQDSAAPGTEAKAHGEGKEYTSAFVCPMHCPGSGSEQAGKCPACGMDYVAQAEHTKDGHTH